MTQTLAPTPETTATTPPIAPVDDLIELRGVLMRDLGYTLERLRRTQGVGVEAETNLVTLLTRGAAFAAIDRHGLAFIYGTPEARAELIALVPEMRRVAI